MPRCRKLATLRRHNTLICPSSYGGVALPGEATGRGGAGREQPRGVAAYHRRKAAISDSTCVTYHYIRSLESLAAHPFKKVDMPCLSSHPLQTHSSYWWSQTFSPGFYIVLLHIYRAAFYPHRSWDHYQVPTYLTCYHFQVCYLITVSFRLLPRKLLRKKQTFSCHAQVPFHNLSYFSSSFLHSYRERIGLVPSPLCPTCGI